MTAATAVLRAQGLGKKYRQRWALSDCTLDVPAGRVVGLVGPNGAGKSTLLNLASGMLAPTTGTIEVCGGRPATGPAQLAKVGYVSQDTPTYAALTVADHLTLGARLNPRWDASLARDRIRRIGLDPSQRAGQLSGGQRAQLALTLGLAKRPELLVLDEPVAALDPLARREFLDDLTDAISGQKMTVLLSSHLISDVERVCDHVIVLVDSRVQVSFAAAELIAGHHRLTGPDGASADLPAGHQVISTSRAHGRTTLVVRADAPATGSASWTVEPVSLEDIVLAYIGRQTADRSSDSRPAAGLGAHR
ncbi:ABC transporter ATP-binding protein [Streptomyces sp. NBC_01220]|uniref:ABC transporter ATP-binding protein n=1 Tax=Streptomyces TaxID=1883 RepID=UPI0027DFB823|nr:ABC transporter ATP-binding protein [Streptomyces poriferorum]WSQ42691.1 ABC transporter ATP-binding protein [Streptomyces sp. NBC_01220]